MPLLSELKRRNVLRVAVAYLTASWLLIQVADAVFPVYHLGVGALGILITVLAACLPMFLAFSWVFEITPHGLRREKDIPDAAQPGQRDSRRLDRAIIILLALALGYFCFDKFVLDPRRDAKLSEKIAQQARADILAESHGDLSIAVLPFDNLNAESSSQYFADGIAEEVLNLLARIPQLRVISRSSSFALKQQNVTIPEVAKKLRVTYVLTGSVRKEGRLVRVRAQLVDAFSDTQLWSEIYERRVKDIFQVQNDIALAVAAAMKLTLVGGPPRSEVTSAEAYELFLQGVYFINKRSTDNYSRAVDYLERSVALDPEYSPAWSAIASTYAILARIGSIDYDDGFRRAREADEKALGLDQGNVLAHSVRAWIAMIYEREYALAAFHFRRAMALQPNNTTVLANSATLAANLGRLQRAIELNQRALAMDPTLAVVYTNLSIQFRALGRLDDAERAARKALELNPDMYSAPGNLAIISLLRGEPAVALAQVDTIKLQNLKQVVLSLAHHGLGNSDESNRILESFIAEHANRWAYDIACVYAWRGESDTAFRWLRRAIDQGQDVGGIKTQPLLAGLHRDPRWDQLLGQLGLADAQVATIEI